MSACGMAISVLLCGPNFDMTQVFQGNAQAAGLFSRQGNALQARDRGTVTGGRSWNFESADSVGACTRRPSPLSQKLSAAAVRLPAAKELGVDDELPGDEIVRTLLQRRIPPRAH